MWQSAERGKAVAMVGDKYRHTFYLVGGEVIVAYSSNKDLSHITFGNETAFFARDDHKYYTIPFFSVGYIETEEIGD
jgi:hypothetical protein